MCEILVKNIFKLMCVSLVTMIVSCGGYETGCTLDESECRDYAELRLQTDGLNWGEPVKTDYNAGYYIFEYSTPENELPLIGPRGINVNCKDGTTAYTLRL